MVYNKAMKDKRKRLILLDAHAILHRAYHALPDFATAKGEPTGALYGLSAMLMKIIEDLKPDYMVAAYDLAGPTYRHEAYKEYKAGRKKAEDDLIAQMKRSRDVFSAMNIPIYDMAGFEADDILGTIVEQLKSRRGSVGGDLEIIIASGDMDTMQLISGEDVKVYTLKKGLSDTIMYDEDAVVKRFGFGPELIADYKGLRGDPSDNIVGVKGVGEKTATALITTFGTVENLYKELEAGENGKGAKTKDGDAASDEKFKKAGITPRLIQVLRDNKEEAEFSKMLATIRRDVPIKFVLPEKSFKEGVDLGKVNALFRELEFRTLPQRMEKLIVGNKAMEFGGSTGARGATDKEGKVGGKKAVGKGGVGENSAGGAGGSSAGGDVSSEAPRENDGKSVISTKSSGEDVSSGVLGESGGFSATLTKSSGGHVPGGADDENEDGQQNSSDLNGHGAASSTANVDKDELENVGLALWLVNSNLTDPTFEDVTNFAGTTDFNEAKKIIMAELDRRNLRKVYEEIELPLIPITHEMEKRGIKIDRVLLSKLAKTYHEEADRLQKRIWELAGSEFNISSPKQLGEVLFDKLGLVGKNMKKTGTGARSTKESELEKLRDLHPIVPLIFEYRELTKLLSTYIDAIPPLLDSNDRLHTDFIPSGTTTGRMASKDPNLQNIPVKSELGRAIRGAFVAEKGYVLASFDYSQMELRIAAFLSGDQKLIDIFKNGEDVHTSVAASVFKVMPADVTPEMRRRAKVINFGILYGMGVLALRQNLGTSREEAQKFLNDYFATFSTLAEYLQKVKLETAARGYTETFFGRRRYFEGINSKLPFIKASAERMAINAPIQGTEADVIKLAMIHIDQYIRKNGLNDKVFPLLQVHDELIYEIKEAEAAKVAPELEKIMESVIDPAKTHGVVMTAESSIGKNWGEL